MQFTHMHNLHHIATVIQRQQNAVNMVENDEQAHYMLHPKYHVVAWASSAGTWVALWLHHHSRTRKHQPAATHLMHRDEGQSGSYGTAGPEPPSHCFLFCCRQTWHQGNSKGVRNEF
jgi:ribulose 1,5-bisphosphate carboxylase large subunit-like protein